MAGVTIAELASLPNSLDRQGSVHHVHMGCPAIVHPHRFTSDESDGSSTVLHITRGQCTWLAGD